MTSSHWWLFHMNIIPTVYYSQMHVLWCVVSVVLFYISNIQGCVSISWIIYSFCLSSVSGILVRHCYIFGGGRGFEFRYAFGGWWFERINIKEVLATLIATGGPKIQAYLKAGAFGFYSILSGTAALLVLGNFGIVGLAASKENLSSIEVENLKLLFHFGM